MREALSINGSPPAVRLNLEAAPSQFTRRLRGATQSESSPWKEFLRKFREDLYPCLAAHGHSWAQGRSATGDNYIYTTVGRSGVTLNVTFNKALSRVSVSIWLETEKAKNYFDLLFRNRESIEADLAGEDATWVRNDDRVSSGVFVGYLYDKDRISEATPEREALFSWIS